MNEYDEASFIIEQAQQKFALDPAQDVRFCFEKAKHDPQDPTIYQPIAPGAIIGSLKGYWASNFNPERLFTLPEDGKLPLYFTVGSASSTAAAAAASCSAAAAKSAAGAASAPEQAAAPTKKSKGKQAEKPYMATFRHAFRENCVRAQDGTPYLSTDNQDEGASPDQDRGRSRGRGKSSGRGEGLISNTGAGAAQGQPKRGRGRPKGSKNKQHLVQAARTKSAAVAGVAAAAAHAHPPRQQRSAPAFDLPGQQPVVRSSGRQTAPVRQWPSD